MNLQSFRYPFRSFQRRFPLQWPLWISVAAGTALVGIGATLSKQILGAEAFPGLSPREAATFLEVCAFSVAAVQVWIIATRTIWAEFSEFCGLLALGISRKQLIGLRLFEAGLGSSISVGGGMLLGWGMLKLLFRSDAGFHWDAMASMLIIGVLPLLAALVVLHTARGKHQLN